MAVVGHNLLRAQIMADPVEGRHPLHGVAVRRAAQGIEVGIDLALDAVAGEQDFFIGQINPDHVVGL